MLANRFLMSTCATCRPRSSRFALLFLHWLCLVPGAHSTHPIEDGRLHTLSPWATPAWHVSATTRTRLSSWTKVSQGYKENGPDMPCLQVKCLHQAT